MPKDTAALRSYFSKLGLDREVADLYMVLHTYGPQNITSLARQAGIERTRVYRLLDILTTTNLVETKTEYKRVILKAAPLSNLNILLTKREQEVRDLQDELERIHRSFTPNGEITHLTHVQFYRGPEGNKQTFWNQTKAKTETLAILFEPMQNKTNLTFFERWVRKCNERGMRFRGIVGDHFLESLQAWYGTHSNERLKHWESRYISPDILPIKHSTITYDDVLIHYNWKDGEVFSAELYNQELADTQRHIFEVLWKQSIPITDDLKWKSPRSK